MENFDTLQVDGSIKKAISKMGFTDPTKIQAQAIPFLLDSNQDFFGQAQTGTGKTAAFVIPLLNKIINSDEESMQLLVLTPTRELAIQVENEFKKFSIGSKVNSHCVYGGVEYEPQIKKLSQLNPKIIVGTPGRVIDLIKKKVIKLNKTSDLILDEADEMLKMGFYEEIIDLLKLFNKKPRMIMFSATMPQGIEKLLNQTFDKPKIINIKSKSLSNDSISQSYYVVRDKHFKEALARLIDIESDNYVIVFCRTKIETKVVADDLKKRGHRVEVLNGDMGQAERELAYRNFKSKKAKILVCTDVAARGLDIDNITHVFNYGMPRDNESYIHRIGRTGRAGSCGHASLIISHSMEKSIKDLERHSKARIIKKSLPSIAQLIEKMVKRETQNARFIKDAIKDKGEDFHIDQSFSIVEEEFKDMSREEILKLMFVWKFNKDMRHYSNLIDIEKESTKSKKPKKSKKGRHDRNRKN